MIPKIIHYVWLGKKQKPKDIVMCMKTWQKKLPGFKLMEWNESNIPFTDNVFLYRAYKEKRWAFVSDYVRMSVINRYGGVYLDTDVIVVRDLEPLLNNDAFVGFESSDLPFSAVFGACPNHPFIRKNLDFYDKLNVEEVNFSDPKIINTNIASDILVDDFGCLRNNKEQCLRGGIHVYPDYMLCKASKKSFTIHVMTGSWKNEKQSSLGIVKRNMRLHLTTSTKAGAYALFKRVLKHKER
jgi:hypothetical protein